MSIQQLPLFENVLPPDDSPPDDTGIVQTILYHNEPENREFKKLCKAGIREMYPEDYQENGNLSDFLLKLLRTHYARTQTPNAAP